MAAMEQVVAGPRPLAGMALLMLAMTASWYVYVPIHELLHALGCLAAGGTVTVLEIQTQYGGALLAEIFPFVQPGGEYAGRLSGFDTHGSDLTYLATDALPFTLSALVGVPIMRACTRTRRPLLFGAGVVLGLAPFYNLPGDYYEMGSIVTTAVVAAFGGEFSGLRSDDLVLLIGQLLSEPETLGVSGPNAATLSIVAVSIVVAVVLAFATWALGDLLATRWVGPSIRPQGAGAAAADAG
jgi:hypothetical protein